MDRLQPTVDELDPDRVAGVLVWDTRGRVGLVPGWVDHGGTTLPHRGVPAHYLGYVASPYHKVFV